MVAKPVPKEWLDPHLFKIEDGDDDETVFDKTVNARIAAEIKPWFFIYRYPSLKADLDKYEKSVKSNCKIRFGKTVDELYASSDRSEEEDMFLHYYEKYYPVSRAPGTMNRICWSIEDSFQGKDVLPNVCFDKNILKSDAQYDYEDYYLVQQLYQEYNNSLQVFLKGSKKNDRNKEDRDLFVSQLNAEFAIACEKVCPNEEVLANILIDVCYSSSKSKAFAWEIAGEQIFKNVLKNNGGILRYPIKDNNGDIEFCGKKFSLHTQQIGGDYDANT